ncbi:hypothetical protein HII31_13301 [Pseudocercospora fuligena]|uniref:Uncharacterized protein n=1 Tax=Pseudocercospora fuligena TaxID=685502 RepID=A0A8H6VC83_9PEZI|nr:hypothetical protein HII31_13301 [Pseudocercospora fuligena]
MLDTGSPPDDGEKDRACSVQPLSSHHASRSSTPGISSLDGTPRYLCFPPSTPTLPRPGSVSPPLPPDMAFKAACLFEPISDGQDDRPSHEQTGAGMTAPLMPRPQRSIRIPSPSRQTNQQAEEPGYMAPLSEISHLLRLQKYHKRRAIQAQENLHYLQIAAAKTARLSRAAHSVQHTLAECIKSEDKNSFANLLHAFQDACDDAFRPTSSTVQEAAPGSTGELRPTSTFLDNLSASSRTTIIDFLSKVRHDGTFMADRLASLSHKELVGLLSQRNTARSSDSIFGTASRSISRTSRPLGFIVDAQVDLLTSHAYGSALETLIFASSGFSQKNLVEEPLITDVWATVCAKLVSEQKPGSERIVPHVLDIWSSLLPWPGKDRLENWILQTLQKGAFLLEQPSKQTFRARVEGRSEVSPEDEARTEAFYVQAADNLLELFGDQNIPSVLPPGAMRLCRAIYDQLRDSTGHQRAFPAFVVTRWLFSSFIMDTLVLPEAHGLLTDHYVSEIARQRILREAAMRAQKAVFDVAYSWKHGNTVSPQTATRVNAIMLRFQGSISGDLSMSATTHTSPKTSAHFMAVSIKDVTTALSALYPQRRPASVSSDIDYHKSGLQSSASSISGFSLFRHEKAFEPIQLTTSVSQDVQNLSITEADALDDSTSDEQIVREAALELEEFATSRVTSSREFWEVFEVHADTPTLTPMREKYSEVQSLRQRKEDHSADMTNLVSPELVPCIKAIEVLLYKFHSELQSLSSRPVPAWPELEALFEQAIQDSQSRSDFVGAHRWFQQRHELHSLAFQQPGKDTLRTVIEHVKLNSEKSIAQSTELQRICEEWSTSTQTQQALRNSNVKPVLDSCERLRDKMWYVADARTSAAYDEARSIASALRIMGRSKRQTRPRMSPPLRHWSTSKISSANLHLKTEAQILDFLSAKPEHGGSNKLSDDQAKGTQQWMDRNNIDNLCRGEERLHKLCMEIRKCVDQITSTSDNSSIFTSVLFARDGPARQTQTLQRRPTLLSGFHSNTTQPHYLSFSNQMRSNDALSSTSHTLSSVSSRDFLDSRSPTLTNKSSMPFWSPAMTEVDSPSSATSVISSQTQAAHDMFVTKLQTPVSFAPDQQAMERLRQRVTSLLLSDLTSVLFKEGSETDSAFWSGLGMELTERHFHALDPLHSSIGSQTPTADSVSTLKPSFARFGFETAFEILLQKFSITSDPAAKLGHIYDIDKLLVPYMIEQGTRGSPSASFMRQASGDAQVEHNTGILCTNETSVTGFRSVFSKSSLRPSTIFRDLQYIAALLPSATLQETPQGKAFTNAAVAITSLKNEVRGIMVETADSIINYHSNNRGHGRTSSTAQQQRDSATFSAPSRTPSAEDIARYSMADAAYLYQIAAKEGDIVAQRELATLYLTHPELMEHVIAPFSRPRDVFKEELEGKWRKNQDPNRCDPVTMCVAHHWMSLSAKGGDSLAKEYLRQREEMDSF